MKTDIVIIGGGAGGMMAAIYAAKTCRVSGKEKKIVLLESQNKVGRKLLATGNGRCNLSACDVSSSMYHSDDMKLVADVLQEVPDARVLFAELGLLCRTDDSGRIYPYSNQASSVLDCLRRCLVELNVLEICDFFVKDMQKQGNQFVITPISGEPVNAEKVILATGGSAAPSLGANDSGFQLAQKMGHTLAIPFGALGPIRVREPYLSGLKGVRIPASVSIVADGVKSECKTGELQFTENALSGICIFEISRQVGEYFALHTIDAKPCQKLEISVDVMPEYTKEQIIALLSGKELETALYGVFHKRVAGVIASRTKTPAEAAAFIKDWRFTPTSAPSLAHAQVTDKAGETKAMFALAPSLAHAQVTAGGVLCKQVGVDLQSKLIPGLYFAGEVLNVDGNCGGYNLHFAWSSGIRAGTAAAEALKKP